MTQPCKDTCATFGGHAFNCPNHPGATVRRHCETCTCPERRHQ